MCQQLIQVGMKDRAGLEFRAEAMAIVVVDLHIEAAGASGHHQADPSHTDDAESLAGDLDAQLSNGAPVSPDVGPQHTRAFVGTARCTEHQQHRNLCSGIAQYVRGVGHRDAPRFCCRQINVVIADRETADGADAIRQAHDHVGIQSLRVAGDDRGGTGGQLEQLIAGVDDIIAI